MISEEESFYFFKRWPGDGWDNWAFEAGGLGVDIFGSADVGVKGAPKPEVNDFFDMNY